MIVVAGGGIIGASISYHLAKRGAAVTILEKRHPGAGATSKSFAWLNASFPKHPRPYFDLNLRGIEGWKRLEREIEGLEISWTGSVEWQASGPEAERFAALVRNHREWGYSTRIIERDEFNRLLPHISPGSIGAASFSDCEGTTDPMGALEALLEAAQKLGVTVHYPCGITGIDVRGGHLRGIRTTEGAMEAARLVLACGTGIPDLARLAGVPVPLIDSPGLLAHSAPLPGVLDRVALAPGAHMKQTGDGSIVTGASAAGSPWDAAPRETGESALQRAARFLPALQGVPLERVAVGYRVMPSDGFPILGPAPGCPNLYIAATHSGMTLAPVIGEIAAREILDCGEVDLDPMFRLARFGTHST